MQGGGLWEWEPPIKLEEVNRLYFGGDFTPSTKRPCID